MNKTTNGRTAGCAWRVWALVLAAAFGTAACVDMALPEAYGGGGVK